MTGTPRGSTTAAARREYNVITIFANASVHWRKYPARLNELAPDTGFIRPGGSSAFCKVFKKYFEARQFAWAPSFETVHSLNPTRDFKNKLKVARQMRVCAHVVARRKFQRPGVGVPDDHTFGFPDLLWGRIDFELEICMLQQIAMAGNRGRPPGIVNKRKRANHNA